MQISGNTTITSVNEDEIAINQPFHKDKLIDFDEHILYVILPLIAETVEVQRVVNVPAQQELGGQNILRACPVGGGKRPFSHQRTT